jgi:hypothetical protein
MCPWVHPRCWAAEDCTVRTIACTVSVGAPVQSAWVRLYSQRNRLYSQHGCACTVSMGVPVQSAWVHLNSQRGCTSTVSVGAPVHSAWVHLYSQRGCACRVSMGAPVQSAWVHLYSQCGCTCTVSTGAPVQSARVQLYSQRERQRALSPTESSQRAGARAVSHQGLPAMPRVWQSPVARTTRASRVWYSAWAAPVGGGPAVALFALHTLRPLLTREAHSPDVSCTRSGSHS